MGHNIFKKYISFYTSFLSDISCFVEAFLVSESNFTKVLQNKVFLTVEDINLHLTR